MIRAKNCEIMSKFVKIMPRILVVSFIPDTAYIHGTPSAIKSCHFCVYDNFGKCGPISIILSRLPL